MQQVCPSPNDDTLDLLETPLTSHAESPNLDCETMNTAVHTVAEFDSMYGAVWDRFRESSSCYRSPFFSRDFLLAVSRHRPNIRVGVCKRGGDAVAFLPFEETGRQQAIPFASAFNDAHGVLTPPNQSIDFTTFLGKLGLRSYRFHALATGANGFESGCLGYRKSYLANLRKYDHRYVEYLEKTRGTIFKQRRKTKKMIRDLGPLRLEFDDRSHHSFDATIAQKRDQYQRTNIFDILSVNWAREFMRDLWQNTTPNSGTGCRGLLSCLYAGDTLVASHYGILEGDWLHYWFPTYHIRWHQYSPGTALFLEIARQSRDLGIDTIDMGYGEQPYKTKLTETISLMPYGIVTDSNWLYAKEKLKLNFESRIKKLPFKETAKVCLRRVYPSFGKSRYE